MKGESSERQLNPRLARLWQFEPFYNDLETPRPIGFLRFWRLIWSFRYKYALRPRHAPIKFCGHASVVAALEEDANNESARFSVPPTKV